MVMQLFAVVLAIIIHSSLQADQETLCETSKNCVQNVMKTCTGSTGFIKPPNQEELEAIDQLNKCLETELKDFEPPEQLVNTDKCNPNKLCPTTTSKPPTTRQFRTRPPKLIRNEVKTGHPTQGQAHRSTHHLTERSLRYCMDVIHDAYEIDTSHGYPCMYLGMYGCYKKTMPECHEECNPTIEAAIKRCRARVSLATANEV